MLCSEVEWTLYAKKHSVLCSEVEHKLDGEGPWSLPDGSEDCQIIFTPGHTEAHCVLLYKPQKVCHALAMWENKGWSLLQGLSLWALPLLILQEPLLTLWGCFPAIDPNCGCVGQVLFSGDHLAADSVAEWNARFEANDDGFLGISRNFNCELQLLPVRVPIHSARIGQ